MMRPFVYKTGNDSLNGFLFLAPALVFMAVFALIPLGASLVLGFFQWPMFAPPKWIGLSNFTQLFQFTQTSGQGLQPNDQNFWQAMTNSSFFLIQIPFQLAWSLILAMLINNRTPLTNFYRTMFFLPVVSSMVAVAVVWRWIYQPSFGLLNSFLAYFGINGPDWLGSPHLAKPSVILLNLWKNGGYQMLIYLAALQGVPETYYEAAEIEGANGFQRFWRITFPIISPTTFFLLVMGVIWTLQMFPQIFVLTQGGPAGYTTTLVYYVYLKAFQDFQMGYASAISMVLFVITVVITIVQWNLRRRWVYGEQ